MVDILVPRSTIFCSQRVGHNCRKTNLDTHHCHHSSTREQQIPRRRADSRQHRVRAAKYNFNLNKIIGSHNNGNTKTKLREGTRTRAACLVSRYISVAGWDAKNNRFFSVDSQTCNQEFGYRCQASQGKLWIAQLALG